MLVRVSLTPGIRAPEGSLTVPDTLPAGTAHRNAPLARSSAIENSNRQLCLCTQNLLDGETCNPLGYWDYYTTKWGRRPLFGGESIPHPFVIRATGFVSNAA